MPLLHCPTSDTLQAFTAGRLSPAETDRIGEHLESCSACQAKLEELDKASEASVDRLIPAADPLPFTDESQCRAVLNQVAHLGSSAPRNPSEAKAVLAAARAHIGRRIGQYELLDLLGEGGMGSVYKARDTELGTIYAIKLLHTRRQTDRAAIERFQREMVAVGQLDHPNIVRAVDAGEEGDLHYLVMEYIDGVDLSRLANRHGQLAVADACELVRQAAEGLAHAHRQGRIHRDIKPSNLMLSRDGQVKLLDLGLARLADTLAEEAPTAEDRASTVETYLTGLTLTNQVMGTLEYMAPEQGADSRNVDARADIYSLGCTLYKLLTGRAPFGEPRYSTSIKQMLAHAQSPVPPVQSLRPEVPQPLAAILERMLAKRPEDRPSSAGEVAAALAPFSTGAKLPRLLEEPGHATERDTESRQPRTLTQTAPRPAMQPAAPASRASMGSILAWLGVAVGVLVMVGVTAAVVATRMSSQPGQIVVAAEDPATSRMLQQGHVAARNLQNSRRYVLKPGPQWLPAGDYSIERALQEIEVSTSRFTMPGGGNIQVSVSLRQSGDLGESTSGDSVAAGGATHFPSVSVTARAATQFPAVDLLKLIDLSRDAFPGTFTRDGDALVSSAEHVARLQIPYVPPESYQLRAVVERLSGADGPNFGMVVAGRQFRVAIDNWPHLGPLSGPSLLDGSGLERHASKAFRGKAIPDRTPVEVLCTLQRSGDQASLQVSCAGRELFTWRGRPAQLSIDAGMGPATPGILFLSVWKTPFRFSKLEIVPLSGPGRAIEFANAESHPDLAALQRVTWKGGSAKLSNDGVEAVLPGFVWAAREGMNPLASSPRVRSIEGPLFAGNDSQTIRQSLDAALADLAAENVVLGTSRVRAIDTRKSPWFSSDDLAHFSGLAELGELKFDTIVSDADLAAFRADKLEALSVAGVKSTGADSGQVLNLPKLRRLELPNAELSAAAIASLAQMPLEELELPYARTEPANLASLAKLNSLRKLVLDHTSIGDEPIKALVSLESLESLSLVGTDVSDSQLERLAALPQLKELNLFDTAATNAGLTKLRGVLPSARVISSADEKIDLLRMADLNSSLVTGNWQLEGDALLAPNGQPALLPIAIEPPEEYEVEIVVERLQGNDSLGLVLVGGRRHFMVGFDQFPHIEGGLTAIDYIDGKRERQNETHVKVPGGFFPAGKAVRALVHVARDRVRVLREGEVLIDWPARFERISFTGVWLPAEPGAIAVGAFRSEFRIREFSLRPLSGSPKSIAVLPTPRGPDRALAQWAIQRGAELTLQFDADNTQIIPPGEPLPGTPFWVHTIRRLTRGEVPGEILKSLGQTRRLAHLDLTGMRFDEAELKHLADHPALRALVLNETAVTSASLPFIARIPRLERLQLMNTAVGDEGVEQLVRLADLYELRLDYSRVTDGALARLAGCRRLSTLGFGHSRVAGTGLAHLSVLPTLRNIYANGLKSLGDEHLAPLASLQLRELQITGSSITSRAGQHLGKITSLQYLNLAQTNLGDDGVKQIDPLRGLISFQVRGGGLTDASLDTLARMTSLETLRLTGNRITDAAIPKIASLSRLRLLYLEGTQITPAGVERLRSALPKCEITPPVFQVDLAGQPIDDAQLPKALADLKPQALSLVGLKITDASMPLLAQIESLTTLNLEDTQVSDEGLTHLAGLTNLRELNLNGTKVTDAGLAHLAPLASLRVLRLGRCKVTGTGLSPLVGKLPLENIQLGSSGVTSGGFQVATKFTALRSLDVAGARINDEDLRHVEGLNDLAFLHLGFTPIQGSGLAYLKRLPRLNSLTLTKAPVDSASMAHVAEIPSLTAVRLDNTKIDDDALAHLAKIARLERLNLDGTKVTAAALAQLRELPTLRALSVAGTSVTDEQAQELVKLMPGCVVHLANRQIVGTAAKPEDAPRSKPHYPPPGGRQIAANGWSGSWSPDGKQVVHGVGRGAGLRIFDLETGESRELYHRGKDPRWSPDGRWIAYVDEPRFDEFRNETIYLISPQGGKPRELVRGKYLSWIEGGKRLVCYSHDLNRHVVVDIDDLDAKPEVYLDRTINQYSAVSPDGLILHDEGTAQLTRAATGESLPAKGLAGVRAHLPAWSAEGKHAVMSSGGVYLYDLGADKATRVLEGPYMAAQLSPDGRHLLVDYRNGSAAEWELWVVDIAAAVEATSAASEASARLDAVYPPKGATLVAKNGFSASWSPDGKEIVYGLSEGQGIEILNLQTQERRIIHSQGKDPRWSPDGRWIAFIQGPSFNDYANETVWLVAPDGKGAREVGRGSYVNWIEGGKRLVYYSRDQQRQLVVEVDAPQAQPQVFHAGSPPYASISPDGKHIAYSQGAKVHVIDLAKREEIFYAGLLERFGGLPTWSADGSRLAIGDLRSRDSGLWLYDLTSNKSTPLLKGPYVRPAFSPDGTKLLFDYAPGVAFQSWQVWMMDTVPGAKQ